MNRRRYSKTFNYPTLWGFTSEKTMFEWIWNNRAHVSFLSGLPLNNPVPAYFAHVLEKGLSKYPEFRLNPDNVILVTWDEHMLIDQGDSDKRARYVKQHPSADFGALELLAEELKEKYQQLFGN
jgi:hypothetical protein